MKNLILAIICLLCFTSCHFYTVLIGGKQRYVKNFLSIRYDTVPINISKVIRTDGFFTNRDINKLAIKSDSDEIVIFYDDGTYLLSSSFQRMRDEIRIAKNVEKTVSKVCKYGLYEVKNDTIIVEEYFIWPLLYGWDMTRWFFKVDDMEHIRLVKIWAWYDANEITEYKHNDVFNFIPAKNLPSTYYSYCKRQKWLWKDKEAWKKWMKEYKVWKKWNKEKHKNMQ